MTGVLPQLPVNYRTSFSNISVEKMETARRQHKEYLQRNGAINFDHLAHRPFTTGRSN
ncbi:MAG: hypothetical protein NC548_11265 [Lachnospiraceae bacterium]|nr:hypothetical protein [Lachnospiraceae bacterium]